MKLNESFCSMSLSETLTSSKAVGWSLTATALEFLLLFPFFKTKITSLPYFRIVVLTSLRYSQAAQCLLS